MERKVVFLVDEFFSVSEGVSAGLFSRIDRKKISDFGKERVRCWNWFFYMGINKEMLL